MILYHCCVFCIDVASAVSRRSSLKNGTPRDLFWPLPGSAMSVSDRKTMALERNHEYFIPTTFHQHQSSDFGEEVENVKITPNDRRTTDDALWKGWAKTKPMFNLSNIWYKRWLLRQPVCYLKFHWSFLSVNSKGFHRSKLRFNVITGILNTPTNSIHVKIQNVNLLRIIDKSDIEIGLYC